jgi:hypothetical protein
MTNTIMGKKDNFPVKHHKLNLNQQSSWSKKDRDIAAATYAFYCLLSISGKFDSLVPYKGPMWLNELGNLIK